MLVRELSELKVSSVDVRLEIKTDLCVYSVHEEVTLTHVPTGVSVSGTAAARSSLTGAAPYPTLQRQLAEKLCRECRSLDVHVKI